MRRLDGLGRVDFTNVLAIVSEREGRGESKWVLKRWRDTEGDAGRDAGGEWGSFYKSDVERKEPSVYIFR